MADLQGGGAPYTHFAHMHGGQYQQAAPQRQPVQQHQGTLPVGVRRGPRGSGGGSREHGGGHQRRPSRDSDAGSSASEQAPTAAMPQAQQAQPPQSNGLLPNGDAVNMQAAPSPVGPGSAVKSAHRPPPPPGFGGAAQAAGGPVRPSPSSNGPPTAGPSQQQSHPQSPQQPRQGQHSAMGGVVGGKPTTIPGAAASANGGGSQLTQISGSPGGQQPPPPRPSSLLPSGSGSAGASTGSSGTAGNAGGSGGGGASTHLNPAAPPFRSLHGGSLEQVEGNLLAQADANGLKDTLSKLRSLMRQRDALDTCLISEASGLVTEAERLAEVREQQRQQQEALEESRARSETLSSLLSERDAQLGAAREQLDKKEAAVRARDAQIRKLESDLAEARRRSSSLERDVASATQRADTSAAKLAAVEQELGALREAYKAQTESHAMEQQQQAAQQQQHQQQQSGGDGYHNKAGPHLGHMGQPLHQMAGGGHPPDGPGPHFPMSLAGLGGHGGAAAGGLKGAPPPPPGGFQVPPPPLPHLFNPIPGAPGTMDAAAAQMASFMDAAGANGAGGLFGGGERFLPPPPPLPGLALPPGFHLPPHPHPPPHHMGHFSAPPSLPSPEEIQAKILDLLPSDAADAVHWDERMDAALDGALAPLQWVRDLAHVYGNPRGFMMAHPELFAQRQDGAVYRAPRGGSGGGNMGAGGSMASRLMGMPPPPGMAPHGPLHAHAPFAVMPGLTATGLVFGSNHY